MQVLHLGRHGHLAPVTAVNQDITQTRMALQSEIFIHARLTHIAVDQQRLQTGIGHGHGDITGRCCFTLTRHRTGQDQCLDRLFQIGELDIRSQRTIGLAFR